MRSSDQDSLKSAANQLEGHTYFLGLAPAKIRSMVRVPVPADSEDLRPAPGPGAIFLTGRCPMIAEALAKTIVEELKRCRRDEDAEVREFSFWMLREIARANHPEITMNSVALSGRA